MKMRATAILRRRGFLSFDVASGLALALLLLTVLAAVAIKQRSAENRLAASRSAARAAEAALLQYQAGQAPPAEARIQPLTDAAPAGHAWVRLTIPPHDNIPAFSLVGLVPAARLQGGKP